MLGAQLALPAAFKGAGAAGFSPPAAANLKGWWKAGEQIYMNAAASFAAASSQYLNVADQAALRGGQDFSFCGWFNCVDAGGVYAILSKDDSTASAREYLLQIEAGGNLKFYIFHSGGLDSVTVSVSYSTWTFFVATYNATSKQLSLQINNGAPATTTHAGTGNTGNSEFRIGASRFGGGSGVNHFNGRIDVVGRWNKVLTPAEITALYNSGSGLSYSGLSGTLLTNLVSFWNLNESSGTRVDSVSGYNLTAVNGPTVGGGIANSLAANNDPIAFWGDQSGSNNHLVQATLANRPTYKTGIKNGYGASLGDGVDDYLNCGFAANPCTMILVAQDVTDTFPPRVCGQGQIYSIFADGGSNYWGFYQMLGGGGIASFNGVDPINWGILAIPLSTAAAQQGRINGANRGSTFTVNAAPTSQFGIHNNGNTSAPLECGNNYVVEAAFYNTTLTLAQIQEWEVYLNAKFAVY